MFQSRCRVPSPSGTDNVVEFHSVPRHGRGSHRPSAYRARAGPPAGHLRTWRQQRGRKGGLARSRHREPRQGPVRMTPSVSSPSASASNVITMRWRMTFRREVLNILGSRIRGCRIKRARARSELAQLIARGDAPYASLNAKRADPMADWLALRARTRSNDLVPISDRDVTVRFSSRARAFVRFGDTTDRIACRAHSQPILPALRRAP